MFGTIAKVNRLLMDPIRSVTLEGSNMRAFALLAVTALVFAAGCAKKDDGSEMTSPGDTSPPADTAPMSPAPSPAEPAPSPSPSETPPPPDANQTPPAEGTTPPPPNQ
jgi:hypothetical protein